MLDACCRSDTLLIRELPQGQLTSIERHAQRERDTAITACLEAAGYYVIRFPKERDRWPEIFKAHADLFGAGKGRG